MSQSAQPVQSSMAMGGASTQRFPISLGLMVLAEICILAALWMFHSRGFKAPALETLAWLWPACWVITIAFCMTLASWGRQFARPRKGVPGSGRLAVVMVFRLCIFSGLLVVPMVATLYAIVMLVLAMASANSGS
ncbi:MAG: hypothetical protein P8M22_12515 [Phycisphaerales bacterium]|nr:hypothetical protein [Phycisphaerales bacterium]